MAPALNRAAALVTFLALSGIGFYTVLYHVVASGGNEVILEKICPQPPAFKRPPQLHYTGFLVPDAILCNLVAFYKALFVPQNIGYTLHFLGGFAPVTLAYLIEGARSDSPRTVSPVVVGLGYQLGSAAGILPLGWLALVLSALGRQDRARKPLTRAQAESVFFGVVLGCVLPTAAMILLLDDYIIAYWQIFPVYIWAFQHLWLVFRRDASASSSGLSVVRTALIAVAAISAIPHLYVLYHNRSLAAFLQWWPSFSVPARRTTTLYTAAAHLLRWDSIIWYTCSTAAAAFLTESISEGLTALAIAAVASVIASPGAAVALLWLRREEKLVKAQKTASSAGVSTSRKKR